MTLRPLVSRADAVVALAAIVGTPACDAHTHDAQETNATAVVSLVNMLMPSQQVIFPCTNAGYGIGGAGECTEASPLRPVSLYGRTKVAAEEVILGHPRGTSLRLATLFGASPRMRLDLMVNDFVYQAVRFHALQLHEGGFRRNFLHVRDAARAICHVIGGQVHPGVYNVGNSRANMTKRQLCERIAERVPEFKWDEVEGKDQDQRDYMVSNAKIQATGFLCVHSLDDGIDELVRAYRMPLVGPAWRSA